MLFVDLTSLRGRISGMERYSYSLMPYLIDNLAERNVPVTVLTAKYSDANALQFTQAYPQLIVKKSPFSSRLLTEQCWIPFLILTDTKNTWFFPCFPPGILTWLFYHANQRIIKTVHDAAMWIKADTLSWKNKLYMKPLETIGISRYHCIHTVSKFSASEITKCFPSVENKIIASGIGVNLTPFKTNIPDDQLLKVTSRYNLPDHYFLCMGTIEPRKNIPFLLKAFSLFMQHRNDNIHLVIAGRYGWEIDRVTRMIDELELEDHVQLIGCVDDEDLPAIYKLAKALLFPSLYEGFGLPVVEAMASGIPVICSNNSSLPEAAGDAAIMLGATDQSAWIEAMDSMITNESLRNDLITKGYIQASTFSWKKVSIKIGSCV